MSAQHLMKRMRFQSMSPTRVAGAYGRDPSRFPTSSTAWPAWLGLRHDVSRQGEKWVSGGSFLKGKWLCAEITQKTGLGDTPPLRLLVPCHDPVLGGLIGNSSAPSLGVRRAHIRAGRCSTKKIEVAMFGALIQSIWPKILFTMARGLMIFNLK